MNGLTVAWLSLPAAIGAAVWATAGATPLVRMLAVVAATFAAAKWIVLAAARRVGVRVPRANLGWFLVWFGMHPRVFVRRRALGRDPAQRALVRRWARLGAVNVTIGVLVALVACAARGPVAALVLLVGCSIAVHFGLFTLLAAGLRARGFPVPLLFDAPWRAATAAELWRERWNRGFAELTALAVQRPLARRCGPRRALLASFAFSGLLHEVALSLPVRAGFGLPTLYFVLQGLVVLRQGERRSRAVTLAAIVLPLPLVFHPWFVRGVLAGVLGA